MRVLLIGTGGREHALALAFAHDPAVDELICAPGNPGMGAIAKLRNVVADDPAAVCELAVDTQADLVVIGPEAPLVAGVADAVRAHGIACFGPSADAARIEGSKDYAKDVMREAGVPTAASVTCHRQADAEAALDRFGPPHVVKDDGLAAGKGVIVTADRDAASAHVSAILSGNDDRAVVIEEFLDGPEASLFVIADGEEAVPLLPAQDFKRVANNDEGPNTGGMGAYAPLPWLAEGFVDEVMETVARPTLKELRRRGAPFNGVLYCGLALTRQGPKVIEFNCRFGDPETQVVLALLDTPLTGILHAAATHTLGSVGPLSWRTGSAVNIVVASQGYPAAPVTGQRIFGAELDGVLHAGTTLAADGTLRASGGRVLNCVAVGEDVTRARENAYKLVSNITLEGCHYRDDIAANVASHPEAAS